MEQKDYMIISVSSFLQWRDTGNTPENIKPWMWRLIEFLRNNNLLVRDDLPISEQEVDERFFLMKSHLTEEGLEVLRGALDSWLDQGDLGIPSTDTTILGHELKKIRGQGGV